MNKENTMENEFDFNPAELEELTFEEAITRLEATVKQLENGNLSLDKSLEKFVYGVNLVKYCNQELNKAEKKVNMVLKDNDDFTEIVPFAEREE